MCKEEKKWEAGKGERWREKARCRMELVSPHVREIENCKTSSAFCMHSRQPFTELRAQRELENYFTIVYAFFKWVMNYFRSFMELSFYTKKILSFTGQKFKIQNIQLTFFKVNGLRKGYGEFWPKFLVFIFAKCPSHYARLICKTLRNQDFFFCLKKIVL